MVSQELNRFMSWILTREHILIWDTGLDLKPVVVRQKTEKET